jgi:hypothetical protein
MFSKQIPQLIHAVRLPVESVLNSSLRRIDFADAYEMRLSKPEIQTSDAYVAIFCYPPTWVQVLMNLRGHIALRLGLTHPLDVREIGPDEQPKVVTGARVGSFTVQSVHPSELIVGNDDKHLNFRISTMKTEREGQFYITVSTAVEIHNMLGRAYMFVVKPFHRFLAPYMLRRAVSSGRL